MRVGTLAEFQEFLKAPLLIGRNKSELQQEIDTNFWAINITPDDQKRLKEADFQVLFRRLYAKSYYYVDNSSYSHGLIFYLWFDEMAGQLRFSFISDFHEVLPFKARVNRVSL